MKQLKDLIASRRARLGICTRKMKETKVIFDGHSGVEIICESIAALKCAMSGFKEAHASVQALMSEEEKETDHTEWYEPKRNDFESYVNHMDEWTHSKVETQRLDLQTETALQSEITPGDSASRIGSKASSSSLSSMRAQAAAEKAALAATAAGLQQKHALELEQAQLQTRMEMIDIQTKMAAADAKLKALESYDSSVHLQSTSDFTSHIPGDGMNAYLESDEEKSPA